MEPIIALTMLKKGKSEKNFLLPRAAQTRLGSERQNYDAEISFKPKSPSLHNLPPYQNFALSIWPPDPTAGT